MNSPRNWRWSAPVCAALFVVAVAIDFIALRVPRAADVEPSRALPLKHLADVPLPGGATRFDYESYDPTRHLLFIAHLGDGEVIVFDVRSAHVIARIDDVEAVHGVLAIPEVGRVYASATGTNEVVAIDEATMKIVARMPGGRYPDGMAYAPDEKILYVSDETGGTETVIDVRTNRRLATLAMGGEVGNTQYDPVSRHVFVNVQTRNRLVEIDPATDRIVRSVDLPSAQHNHGLLIDAQDHLAFVACDGNNRLLVLDMRTMQVAQSFTVGKDPDVLAFDSRAGVLYVAGEAGIVSMFGVKGASVMKLGEGRLGPNAHVVAVDAAPHRAYFPLKDIGGRPLLRIMAPRP